MTSTRSVGVKKGAWTAEEDKLLKKCIEKYGEGKWHQIPIKAGLNRCRKSCRLRWLNYLRPNIKRGDFEEDEIDLMIRLHKLLGNRWSLIAGRIPGRTANDVKNYWNTHLQKKPSAHQHNQKKETEDEKSNQETTTIIKPRPRTFSKAPVWFMGKRNNQSNIAAHDKEDNNMTRLSKDGVYENTESPQILLPSPEVMSGGINECWDTLFDEDVDGQIGWSFGGLPEKEAASDNVVQEDGQNSWFDLSIDDDVWDILNSDK